MRKTFNFALGLFFGGLVGAMIALLFAPQRGEETVRIIRARIQEIVDEAKRAAAERRAELEEQFMAARQVRTGQ
ncbi:MAG: YtxH domain-containing protein [Anaerolineae bacterium]|jgi:gas vesicle protein|nr:YtxH domain-containing protein [Anaerolineae bacterium]MDH7474393.1 YtxH domain-containing protein [Anaerolineae bacterium]